MMVEEENLNNEKKMDWKQFCLKLFLPPTRGSNSYIRTISMNKDKVLLLISKIKITN